MDLNHIILPVSLIIDLYPNSLVETGEIITKSQPNRPEKSNETEGSIEAVKAEKSLENVRNDPENKSSDLVWMGKNQKQILVMVNFADSLHLPEKDLKFLTGILSACKLRIDDVAIINRNNKPEADYKELSTSFKTKVILLFDVSPGDFGLPMNFPHFQLQAFANNTFLFSPSLSELEEDKVLKSKLWVSLRRLFNI
jgi:hypothetical protein